MEKKIIRQTLDPFFISLFIVAALVLTVFYLVYYPKKLSDNIKLCLEGTADQITKVEIDQTILEKQDQNWIIASNNNLPADESKINQLLTILGQIKKDSIVSKNKQYHEKYGVDEQLSIKAFNGQEEMLSLLIGDVGPGFTGTYFRHPENDTVYLSKISLRSTIIQNNWKDLSITSFYSDEVIKIKINNQMFENLEDEKVKTLISHLTGLAADDVVKPKEELTQADPNNIKIYLENGETQFTIFTNEKNFYAIKIDQPDFAYQLNQVKAEAINAAITSLLSS